MSRKPKDEDIRLINDNLRFFKRKMEEIKADCQKNPCNDIEDKDKRDKESARQAVLVDKLFSWNDKYMESCGVMEIFRAYEEKNKERKNSKRSGIQDNLDSI